MFLKFFLNLTTSNDNNNPDLCDTRKRMPKHVMDIRSIFLFNLIKHLLVNIGFAIDYLKLRMPMFLSVS